MPVTPNSIFTTTGETTPLIKHISEQPLAPVYFSFIPPIEKTLKITKKIKVYGSKITAMMPVSLYGYPAIGGIRLQNL